MPDTIATAGDLRAFLATVMVGVRDGKVDPVKAGCVAKLAQQLNESFYAEAVVTKGREDAWAIGNLTLGPSGEREAAVERRRLAAA